MGAVRSLQLTMSVDPTTLDTLFASRGGFDAVYKKLIAASKALLRTYGGDSAARVVLRQLDGEEIVDHAFTRLFNEGFSPEDDPYLLLRRHIRNYLRSVAKSAKEGRTARVIGNEDLTRAYEQETDLNGQTTVERLLIIDDVDHCLKVMARVVTLANDDHQVTAIAQAIINGFRDPHEICTLTDLDKTTYENAFKRLRRKFGQAVEEIAKEEK